MLAGTSQTDPAVESVVANVRSELDDTANSSAPIDVGFGWYTSGAGAMTEQDRANFYSQVADRLARSDCGVDGLLARSWVTPEDDPDNTSAWYGRVDPQTFQLGPTAQAYRDLARTYLGYGPDPAPRAVVHICFHQAPDSDGEGVPDAAEDYPLDPQHADALDTPPPAPSIDRAPTQWSNSAGAAFTYSATGATSYWCTLDGSDPAVCDPSGRAYSSLSPGEHTFTVQALDALGLVGPKTSYTWTIDRTPPETTIDSHPDTTILTDSATFAVSSNEDGATFVYRLDSAAYRSCDSPTTFSGLTDGTHVFKVAAIDRAGNGDSTPDSFTFEVHTVPGAPTITSGPAAGAVTRPRPTFGFDAPYAVGYQCRYDGQPFTACSGSQSDTPDTALTDGPHTFEVRGIGGTGTPGPSTTRSFTVDGTPPQTTITQGPVRTSDPRTVWFAFTSSEPGARLYCRLDTAPYQHCDTGSYAARDLSDGTHVFRVTSIDRAGNRDPTPAVRTFSVP